MEMKFRCRLVLTAGWLLFYGVLASVDSFR
jgi:hypothetical protein